MEKEKKEEPAPQNRLSHREEIEVLIERILRGCLQIEDTIRKLTDFIERREDRLTQQINRTHARLIDRVFNEYPIDIHDTPIFPSPPTSER